jgi:putative FmdB family regulatory protein
MPTYEYICHLCGHRFERFQSIQAEPVHECPVCSSDKVEKIMTGGIGLIFKGKGFYITDYKKSNRDSTPEKPKTVSPDKKKEKSE